MIDWSKVRSDNNTRNMKAEPPLCRVDTVNTVKSETDSVLLLHSGKIIVLLLYFIYFFYKQ